MARPHVYGECTVCSSLPSISRACSGGCAAAARPPGRGCCAATRSRCSLRSGPACRRLPSCASSRSINLNTAATRPLPDAENPGRPTRARSPRRVNRGCRSRCPTHSSSAAASRNTSTVAVSAPEPREREAESSGAGPRGERSSGESGERSAPGRAPHRCVGGPGRCPPKSRARPSRSPSPAVITSVAPNCCANRFEHKRTAEVVCARSGFSPGVQGSRGGIHFMSASESVQPCGSAARNPCSRGDGVTLPAPIHPRQVTNTPPVPDQRALLSTADWQP